MIQKIKEFIHRNKRIMIILFIIFLLLLFFAFSFQEIFMNHKKNHSEFQEFSDDVKELNGTKVYSNDQLTKEHCLGDICVYDVSFRYVNQIQVVDYTIKNRSKKTLTGDLYMHYGDEKILLSYYSLKPGKTVKRSFQMFGSNFVEQEDYTLSELTDEERKAIQVSE